MLVDMLVEGYCFQAIRTLPCRLCTRRNPFHGFPPSCGGAAFANSFSNGMTETAATFLGERIAIPTKCGYRKSCCSRRASRR